MQSQVDVIKMYHIFVLFYYWKQNTTSAIPRIGLGALYIINRLNIVVL